MFMIFRIAWYSAQTSFIIKYTFEASSSILCNNLVSCVDTVMQFHPQDLFHGISAD